MTLSPLSGAVLRILAWSLLLAGGVAGIVLPHPVTTALWTAATRLFAKAGDAGMVARLTSATKFGPRIRRGLARDPGARPTRLSLA
ncbi:hypothetical protein EIB18_18115 [Caulobacter vibrioides]|uniref:hypothetical protein n=1 Tax=Caulobacter vibrioides TaxID=155892 RepID=UPI000BB509E7|nr:hypothetical protein [Caulobacter vibrioides]ATC26294.1 hypothetical protein CA608_18010 [Caulobacter vibrioides]AZH14428.1 hypothetical protein EIB18_18115 [Caulobacter vibrioides]PLR10850.1 hypothetical protein CVUC_12265 [Caulobacter vibrioides]